MKMPKTSFSATVRIKLTDYSNKHQRQCHFACVWDW